MQQEGGNFKKLGKVLSVCSFVFKSNFLVWTLRKIYCPPTSTKISYGDSLMCDVASTSTSEGYKSFWKFTIQIKLWHLVDVYNYSLVWIRLFDIKDTRQPLSVKLISDVYLIERPSYVHPWYQATLYRPTENFYISRCCNADGHIW